MSYSAHQLNWVLGWPAVASGPALKKQIASVLQTASFARLRRGIYYYSRADDQCRCEVRAARTPANHINRRCTPRAVAANEQLLSSPRVDAAKREALAGRRYVITETG